MGWCIGQEVSMPFEKALWPMEKGLLWKGEVIDSIG